MVYVDRGWTDSPLWTGLRWSEYDFETFDYLTIYISKIMDRQCPLTAVVVREGSLTEARRQDTRASRTTSQWERP